MLISSAKKFFRRRPRGFQFMGMGRQMNARGRTTTPPERLLALAGLGYLGASTKFMLHPGNEELTADKRHYLYGASGWQNLGTLSRGDVKKELFSGALTTIAAGSLGPNGRIEAAATSVASSVISDWTEYQADATAEADSSFGTKYKVARTTTDFALMISDAISAGVRPVWRFAIKAGVGTNAGKATVGFLDLTVAWYIGVTASIISGPGSLAGTENVSVSGLSTSEWTIIELRANAALPNNGEARCFIDGTDAGEIGDYGYIAYSLIHDGLYASTWISGASSTLRAADALRYTGLSGLTSGGMLAMLRLSYAGSAMAADMTHLAINGSDSLDNAVRIYTEADDNKLYAELFSGGVSQGTVDLGTYTANTQYAIALDWDATGLRACINGTEKTATGAVTVPAAITNLEIGRGISTDTAHGGETPLVMLFSALSTAERAAITGAAMRSAAFAGI